jgi:hypothetical protein
MHYITSAIIISIIYVIAFILFDESMHHLCGVKSAELNVTHRCLFEFFTVFIISLLLSITSVDAIICSAH